MTIPQPLFYFWAPHSIHAPLEVPEDAYEHFSYITENDHRRRYQSMVWNIDKYIGEVVVLLQQKGMWNNTLLVLHAE